MKKLLTALLFLQILNCSNLKGQYSNEWTKYPYIQNGYSLNDNQVDESGNLYFIERKPGYNDHNVLKKMNSQGNIVWENYLTVGEFGIHWGLNVKFKLRNNFLYVCYSAYDTSIWVENPKDPKQIESRNIYGIYLTKFDLSGNLIFNEKYMPDQITALDNVKFLQSFDVDNTGNIIMGGINYYYYRLLYPDYYTTIQNFLFKVDSAGIPQWEYEYTPLIISDFEDHITEVKCFDNDNIYSMYAEHGYHNYKLYKHDQSGNNTAVHQLSQSIVSGQTFEVSSNNKIGVANNDQFLIFNSSLQIERVIHFSGLPGYYNTQFSYKFDNSNGLYLTARAVKNSKSYPYFAKINSNTGDVIWKRVYESDLNSFYDIFPSPLVNKKEDVFQFGTAVKENTLQTRAFLVGYDSSGNLTGESFHKYLPGPDNNYSQYNDLCFYNDTVYAIGTENYPGQATYYKGFIEKLEPGISITSPKPDERWISGEVDTIKWIGGKPGQLITIEYSIDSGRTYELIDFAIPGDQGYFIWNIPEDLLSAYSKIQIINSLNNSDTLAVSDYFKLKGYVLTRFLADGNYDPFNITYNGWFFLNDTIPMWPQVWWHDQFQYSLATDPYTSKGYPEFFHHISESSFPDWPLWVEVFGDSRCYRSTLLNIYNISAQEKWKKIAEAFGGTCFGLAASSFLAFNFREEFALKHPGVPDVDSIGNLYITNTIRKTINGYFIYQFGKQTFNNDVTSERKDARTTLEEVKEMFIKDVTDIRTISIYNDPDNLFPGKNTGAHTMAPVKVTKDTLPSRYRIHVYDSNNPGSDGFIIIDSAANTWSFPALGPTWTGGKGCYLEIPVSNFINQPVLGDNPVNPENIKGRGINNIEIYNTPDADIMLTASNNQRIGYQNGKTIKELNNGIPIIIKNGSNSDPIGYYIPDGSYSAVLKNVRDSSRTAHISMFKNDVIYTYERENADPSETDRFTFGDGFSVTSPDASQKEIEMKVIAPLVNSDRLFKVSNTLLRQNDSLHLNAVNNEKLIIKNFGQEKNYKLEINERSSTEEKIFENDSVNLQANSTHIIVPDWTDPNLGAVTIYIDTGNNGTIDDSTYIFNQVSSAMQLNLTMFIEGFYDAGSNSQISDTITVYLRSIVSPFAKVDSAKGVVTANGSASLLFNNASGGTYYLAVTHRNSIETWCATGITVNAGGSVNYDLSSSASQAFGSNMKQADSSPVRFAIYSGDVNQDGTIDASDVSEVDNDANNSFSGYVRTDVTGDDFVDAADVSIVDNNAFNSVSAITP